MSFWRRPPPTPTEQPTVQPTVQPTRERLSVRDQTTLALFFGVYLGVDTRRWPELNSRESLSEDALASMEAGPVGNDAWSLLRFGSYRSGFAAVPCWALVFTSLERQGSRVDDPALPGTWWIDGNNAYPKNAGVRRLTPASLTPLPIDAEAQAAREDIIGAFSSDDLRERLRGALDWHAIALIDSKHI